MVPGSQDEQAGLGLFDMSTFLYLQATMNTEASL